MSSDYRQAFVDAVSESLISELTSEQIDFVTRKMLKALNDYEITKRCLDIIPYDDENQRIVKRYCACLVIDGKSDKTIACYRRAISVFLATVQKNIKDCGTYDIRYYLACEKERGVSNRTLENYRSYLSAFFQWLAAEEIIDKNPCAKIKTIKYTDEVRKPFSSTEIDRLRSACTGSKQRALVEFLLSSGVRVNELTTMAISDIDFSSYTVHVREGKGGKERITYINDVAAMHLQQYLSDRTEDGPYLFYSKNHEPLTSSGVRFILRELGKKASVEDVHPHRFRRTFATGLATRGMQVQEVQKLLGHSDVNTTLEYVCTDDDKVKTSYKQFIT